MKELTQAAVLTPASMLGEGLGQGMVRGASVPSENSCCESLLMDPQSSSELAKDQKPTSRLHYRSLTWYVLSLTTV